MPSRKRWRRCCDAAEAANVGDAFTMIQDEERDT